MKKLITIIVLSMGFSVLGQDIHYTQAQSTPMLINPAATGIFHGWERIAVNHKNQWVNTGTKFYTTSLAFDMNVFKPKRGNKAHMGLGLQLYNDIGGDSKFGTKQMLFNVSGIVPLNDMHEISGGLQFGIGQRTGDLTDLVFSNQFNGTELDPTINSQEFNNLVSFMYPDVSMGLMYMYGNHKVGLSRDDVIEFRVGFSMFHVNTPELNYRIGFTEQLFSKMVIHSSFLKDFSDSKVGMEIFFNQYIQGPHNETLYGGMLRYRLTDGSKTTGLTRDTHINIGFVHRIGDSFAPMLQVLYGNFNFGVSYDVTTSEFGQVSRAGGLEFSLIFANLDFALFNRSRL